MASTDCEIDEPGCNGALGMLVRGPSRRWPAPASSRHALMALIPACRRCRRPSTMPIAYSLDLGQRRKQGVDRVPAGDIERRTRSARSDAEHRIGRRHIDVIAPDGWSVRDRDRHAGVARQDPEAGFALGATWVTMEGDAEVRGHVPEQTFQRPYPPAEAPTMGKGPSMAACRCSFRQRLFPGSRAGTDGDQREDIDCGDDHAGILVTAEFYDQRPPR